MIGSRTHRGFEYKKLFVWLVVLAVVAVIAFFVLRNLSSPAEGSVTQTNLGSATSNAANTPGQYSDQYLSFTYPSDYKVTPIQKSVGYLDAVRFSNTDHSGKYISVSVIRGQMANDSTINYRRQHPDIYKIVLDTPTQVVFSSSQNGGEYTGYIYHNGIVISISLTSLGSTNLSRDYQTIASSLQWKQ